LPWGEQWGYNRQATLYLPPAAQLGEAVSFQLALQPNSLSSPCVLDGAGAGAGAGVGMEGRPSAAPSDHQAKSYIAVIPTGGGS